MRNVVQQSFVVFTIGVKSYTVVYQKYMKENVVSSEISIQNKAEMSFQMERIWLWTRLLILNNICLMMYEIKSIIPWTRPILYCSLSVFAALVKFYHIYIYIHTHFFKLNNLILSYIVNPFSTMTILLSSWQQQHYTPMTIPLSSWSFSVFPA